MLPTASRPLHPDAGEQQHARDGDRPADHRKRCRRQHRDAGQQVGADDHPPHADPFGEPPDQHGEEQHGIAERDHHRADQVAVARDHQIERREGEELRPPAGAAERDQPAEAKAGLRREAADAAERIGRGGSRPGRGDRRVVRQADGPERGEQQQRCRGAQPVRGDRAELRIQVHAERGAKRSRRRPRPRGGTAPRARSRRAG